MNTENTMSVSSKQYTETEQELAKSFLEGIFSNYLEQIENDIRKHEQLLKHCDNSQSIDFIANTKRRLSQSKKEKQETCFVIDYLKQKGAL